MTTKKNAPTMPGDTARAQHRPNDEPIGHCRRAPASRCGPGDAASPDHHAGFQNAKTALLALTQATLIGRAES